MVFIPILAFAQWTSLYICMRVLCANCTQNWQPQHTELNSLLEYAMISFLIAWTFSVFLSPIISSLSKGSWWDYKLCLCVWSSVLPQEPRPAHASYPLPGVCELEEDSRQKFKHQKEARAPYCALNKCQKTLKRILHSSLYCRVVESNELKTSGLTYALFFAGGRISALSNISCSGSGW